jgi:hypothetical protein
VLFSHLKKEELHSSRAITTYHRSFEFTWTGLARSQAVSRAKRSYTPGRSNHVIAFREQSDIWLKEMNRNLVVKNLGATMVKGGLGASAISTYTNAVKTVVASAVNEEGDPLHPRK